MKNKALLLGGSGQLGTQIQVRWSNWEIVAPSHEELQLGDMQATAAVVAATAPHIVIDCAAFHNVDRCEDEPERAFFENAIAVDRLAGFCDDIGARLVTVSTDYVFDGESSHPYLEDDAPRPLSAYGVSKYAGELFVQRRTGKHLIVRTCGVYGVRPSTTKGYTFIDRIITQARAGEVIRVVDDVIASPTYARHLAEATVKLVDAGASGIVHVVNDGAISWHAFATEALRQAGISHPIEAIGSADWKAKAIRPRYSALASGRLKEFGVVMPSWQDGIRDYLADREARKHLP